MRRQLRRMKVRCSMRASPARDQLCSTAVKRAAPPGKAADMGQAERLLGHLLVLAKALSEGSGINLPTATGIGHIQAR